MQQRTNVRVIAPVDEENYFKEGPCQTGDLTAAWLDNLRQLNVCSQKGLVERFDSSIGAGTVLTPFGGKYQLIKSEITTKRGSHEQLKSLQTKPKSLKVRLLVIFEILQSVDL